MSEKRESGYVQREREREGESHMHTPRRRADKERASLCEREKEIDKKRRERKRGHTTYFLYGAYSWHDTYKKILTETMDNEWRKPEW